MATQGLATVLLLSLLPAQGPAGGAQEAGLVAFRQALLDASVDSRVVIVATHPDDTYRGMAVYMRRVLGLDVTVVVATRGEGGQNAIGPVGSVLAGIRSRESVDAARELGVKLRFLELSDFGYCRTAAEAMDRWRSLDPVRRLEGVLQELAPDLILTPHRSGEGHGQKKALLYVLERVIQGMSTTRPVFYRAVTEEKDADLVLDLDRSDPLRGSTYRALAYRALLMHETQGPHPAAMEDAIPAHVLLERVGGSGNRSSLVEGLSSLWTYRESLDGLLQKLGSTTRAQELETWFAGLPAIPRREQALVTMLQKLPLLRRLLGEALDPSDLHRRLAQRIKAIEHAILLAAGVEMSWSVPESMDLEQKQSASTLDLRNSGKTPLQCRIHGLMEGSPFRLVTRNGTQRAFELPANGEKSLRLDLKVDNRTLSLGRERVTIQFDLRVRGVDLLVELTREIQILPPLRIQALPDDHFLVPVGCHDFQFSLRFLSSGRRSIAGELAMTGPLGIAFLPESRREELPIRVQLQEKMRESMLSLRVILTDKSKLLHKEPRPFDLRFYVADTKSGNPVSRQGCRVTVIPVRVKRPKGLRIGIVRGPDPTVKNSLESLIGGVEDLDPQSLARKDLDAYDTIVIDSRALQRRLDLRAQIGRFLAFAKRGKHLVVLYHKANEFNQDLHGSLLAPYPLKLGSERVTREDAPVKILRPEHRLMTYPNRLKAADWDHWVQERGLYFPEMGTLQYHLYEEIIAIQELPMKEIRGLEGKDSQPEFVPQKGSILFANTGAGSYVYCALVLQRQLQVYHAGAARLLVNLVTPPSWTEIE